MIVLGKRVLIEQTATRKKSAIHVLGNKEDANIFDISFKILKLGDNLPEGHKLKVGDEVVLGRHSQPNPIKEVLNTNDKTVFLLIAHYEDIEGIYEKGDKK